MQEGSINMISSAQKAAASMGAWRPEYAIYTCNLVYFGCVAGIVATLFNSIAFSTHNWLEGPGQEHSPFLSLGFHEACFHECRSPYCPGGDYTFMYHGCAWIFSEHFMEIWEWLRPDWYMDCWNLSVASVPMSLVTFILLIVCACVVALGQRSRPSGRRETASIVLLYLVIPIQFATALVILIILAIFRMNCFTLGWMPMPSRNKLGYGFWLTVAADALYFISTITLFLALVLKQLWKNFMRLEPGGGIDMMLGAT